jgi:hypothetical protein
MSATPPPLYNSGVNKAEIAGLFREEPSLRAGRDRFARTAPAETSDPETQRATRDLINRFRK